MGIVWRGVDQASGLGVAVKTVRVPSAGLVAGIRREVLALRRLRHPGVVRIEEVGLNEGLPWYAMEFVEGATLRQWIEALRDAEGRAPVAAPLRDASTMEHPRPDPALTGPEGDAPPRALVAAPSETFLRAVLRVFRALCVPLGFVHGQGIVHRDLKPSNVMVRPSGQPVLMDFGIVSRVEGPAGREVVDVGQHLVGTTAYMAPEQFLGERVDARADLYALGCMLFEAFAGRTPFEARSSLELVGMLLLMPVPRLSSVMAGVPEGLDALVARLLEKEPRRRFAHAYDVARAIDALGLFEDAAPLAEADVSPSAYLYRPALVGREPQLDALKARFHALTDEGRGACVLLGGESGVGKTRLAGEIARQAAVARVLVVAGECVPMTRPESVLSDEPSPAGFASAHATPAVSQVVRATGLDRGVSRGAAFHPLRALFQSLGDRCRAQGPELTEALLGPRAWVLAPYEPGLARVPGVERYPMPPELPSTAARRRLLDAVLETLSALSKREPVLIVLDDLQWSDDLTLAVLAALTPQWLAANRVFFLGTFRSREADAVLRRVLSLDAVELMNVEGLDTGDVASLVCDMLALPEAPPTLLAHLQTQSQGNPFYVAEFLRMAVAEGIIGRARAGRWEIPSEASRFPAVSGLRALVGRRMQGLSPESQALVSAAAVLGREADVEFLGELAGLSESEWLDAVRELMQRQVLEEAAESRVRFVHDKLREVAYAGLDPARKVALHKIAAERLVARYGETPLAPLFYPDFAHHFDAAGVADEAARWASRAGQFAYANGAFPDAMRYFERALRGASLDAVEALHLRWQAGDAAFAVGELGRATEHLQGVTAAFNEAVPDKPLARAWYLVRHVGELVWRRTFSPRSRALDARQREALTLASLSAGRYSNVCIYRSDGFGVLAGSLAASNLAERAGEAHIDALGALGYALGTLGLHRAAERSFAHARATRDRYDAAQSAGEPVSMWRGHGAHLVLETTYRLARNDLTRATSLCTEGLAVTRGKGDRLDEALFESLYAAIDFYEGRFLRGHSRFVRALEGLGDDLLGQRLPFVASDVQLLVLLDRRDAVAQRLVDLVAVKPRGDRLIDSMVAAARALAHHCLGEHAPALEQAAEAVRHWPHPLAVPPTAHMLYTALLPVYEHAWRGHASHANASALAKLARTATRWAQSTRVGRVFALRAAGLAAMTRGDRAEATRAWQHGLSLARDDRQRHEQRLLSRHLLDTGRIGESERQAIARSLAVLDDLIARDDVPEVISVASTTPLLDSPSLSKDGRELKERRAG